MRRREFISLLGGAAAGWPLAARAQQTERVRRIGVLMNLRESDPEGSPRVAAFRQRLRDLGWTEGGNLRIDFRWAEADTERLRAYAAELIRSKPDLIVAHTGSGLAAVRQSVDLPVVFVQASDPVASGFASSLANPGGNITGFTTFEYSMGGKWLEMLKEIAPKVDAGRAPDEYAEPQLDRMATGDRGCCTRPGFADHPCRRARG